MSKQEKRPIIGLVPLVDQERESYWMLPGYMEGIREAGGLPIMLPLTEDEAEIEQLVKLCDGLLFTGGHDVSPAVYGKTDETGNVVPCLERDSMERILLQKALERNVPILGICRGLQFINAALGGTLYQDLPMQNPSKVDHRQKPPYDLPSHEVTLADNGGLYALLETKRLPVNSCHHQGIRTLADGLCAMAFSDDGLIEAIEKPNVKFLWAVQWHPEFMHRRDEASRKIFSRFVGACR